MSKGAKPLGIPTTSAVVKSQPDPKPSGPINLKKYIYLAARHGPTVFGSAPTAYGKFPLMDLPAARPAPIGGPNDTTYWRCSNHRVYSP